MGFGLAILHETDENRPSIVKSICFGGTYKPSKPAFGMIPDAKSTMSLYYRDSGEEVREDLYAIDPATPFDEPEQANIEDAGQSVVGRKGESSKMLMLKLYDLVVELKDSGIPASMLEKAFAQILAKVSPEEEKQEDLQIKPSQNPPLTNPTSTTPVMAASAGPIQADPVKPMPTDSLSKATVARILKQFAAQSAGRQGVDLHYLLSELSEDPRSLRQLGREYHIKFQTLSDRAKIYRPLLNPSETESPAAEKTAAESKYAFLRDGITTMSLLWFTRPLTGCGAKKSSRTFPWSKTLLLDFAHRFYPRCTCKADLESKNIPIAERMAVAKRTSRPLNQCPTCRSRSQNYQATPPLAKDPPRPFAINEKVHELLLNPRFMRDYMQVREQLVQSHGFWIFDRITPVTDVGFETLFSSSSKPLSRGPHLAQFLGNRKPWLGVMEENRLEHIRVELEFPEYIFDVLGSQAEATTYHEATLLPGEDSMKKSYAKLADQILNEATCAIERKQNPEHGK